MHRREFLKGVACASVAASLASRTHAHAAETIDLKGAIDMHVHCSPDTIKRLMTAPDYVKDCKARGMDAVVLKCHQFNTNEMADTISQFVPGIKVFGSITLNETFGPTINVFAAKQAISMSDGKCACVWLPTQSAVADKKAKGQTGGLPVCDAEGKVVPEVVSLMELCAEKNVILATGHSAPEECVALSIKAHEVGLHKLVCTHFSSPMRHVATQVQAETCLKNGAWLEHSFVNWYDLDDKDAFVKRVASFIDLDPTHQFIDTDLGQPKNPHPCDGLRQFITELERVAGYTQEKIRLINHDVPSFLLGLDNQAPKASV